MRPILLLPIAALLAVGCARAPGANVPGEPAPAVAPNDRELLPDQQIQQVLNRLAFGPRPGDAARVRAMGVDRWMALQLAPDHIDDRATDELVRGYDVLRTPTDRLVADFRKAAEARRRVQLAARNDGDTVNRRAALREIARDDPALADAARHTARVVPDLQSAHLTRAVSSERQLEEVMVDFWENHFSVFAGKGLTRLYLADYDENVIRPRALGKFRDLLGAVAHSPAMLFYLDNWQSAADSSHPTFAGPAAMGRRGRRARAAAAASREVFERAAATGQIPPRVLVQLPPEARARWERATPDQRRRFLRQLQQRRQALGLNENYARELMELHTLGVNGGYTQQDVIEVARALTGWSIDQRTGRFVFRPEMHDAGEKHVLGHVLRPGRGEQDGEEVLDILARSPATARFIATKLVRHFVSDSAPPALVERAARSYVQTDGDIREVMRTIITSPEFFGRAAYRAKVKTPFELVASALRAMGAAPDTTARSARIVAFLGQPIYGRQTPDGWPDQGDAWMNTGAILNRINFGLALAANRVPGAGMRSWPLADSLRGLDREQQVDGVVRSLLGGEVSTITRRVLVSGRNPMTGGQPPDASALDDAAADGAMRAEPPRRRPGAAGRAALARPVDLQGLAQVVGLALGAPEFQRR